MVLLLNRLGQTKSNAPHKPLTGSLTYFYLYLGWIDNTCNCKQIARQDYSSFLTSMYDYLILSLFKFLKSLNIFLIPITIDHFDFNPS